MEVEIGQDFLEKYGLSGLSSIIAAAIVRAERADPREKKILFHRTIHEVCRVALKSGIEPIDLCEAAMIILEFSNSEITRLRKELEAKKYAEQKTEEAKLEAELAKKEP